MSLREATDYVDLVIEELHNRGIIPESQYGKMPESLREELADKIIARSQE